MTDREKLSSEQFFHVSSTRDVKIVFFLKIDYHLLKIDFFLDYRF